MQIFVSSEPGRGASLRVGANANLTVYLSVSVCVCVCSGLHFEAKWGCCRAADNLIRIQNAFSLSPSLKLTPEFQVHGVDICSCWPTHSRALSIPSAPFFLLLLAIVLLMGLPRSALVLQLSYKAAAHNHTKFDFVCHYFRLDGKCFD